MSMHDIQQQPRGYATVRTRSSAKRSRVATALIAPSDILREITKFLPDDDYCYWRRTSRSNQLQSHPLAWDGAYIADGCLVVTGMLKSTQVQWLSSLDNRVTRITTESVSCIENLPLLRLVTSINTCYPNRHDGPNCLEDGYGYNVTTQQLLALWNAVPNLKELDMGDLAHGQLLLHYDTFEKCPKLKHVSGHDCSRDHGYEWGWTRGMISGEDVTDY